MSSYGRYNSHSQSQSQSYAPSAPELPPPTNYTPPNNNYTQTSPPSSNYNNYPHGYSHGQASSSGYPPPPVSSSSGYSNFPPGTNPDVIRSFQMVDRDRSGFIDDRELQQALSSSFHSFNLRTIRLLMFLFKHPRESLRIGPKEFTELWSCLGHWRIVEADFYNSHGQFVMDGGFLAFSHDPSSSIDNIDGIFERYDKDRSGKIDPLELRDALYGIGYAVPASVLQLLLSKYSDGNSRRVELGFDSFVECGMIIKGLTDKFKDKDKRYSGSATLSYDDFMSMVIPFLVSYD